MPDSGAHCTFSYSLSLLSFHFMKQKSYLPILQEAHRRPAVRVKQFHSIRKTELHPRSRYRISASLRRVWDWTERMQRQSPEGKMWGQEPRLQRAKLTPGM